MSNKEPPATVTRDAILKWIKTHSIATPETAKHVEIQAQLPPMTRLEPQIIAQMTPAVEHLSASSNSLTALPSLSALHQLRILSVGRNLLRRLEHLDTIAATLEQIWASYNQIDSIGDDSGIDKCLELTHLYLSNNKIKSFDELKKVAHLPHLSDLILRGNPCYNGWNDPELRQQILKRLPTLRKIDGFPVTERERMAAALLTEEDTQLSAAEWYATKGTKVVSTMTGLKKKEAAGGTATTTSGKPTAKGSATTPIPPASPRKSPTTAASPSPPPPKSSSSAAAISPRRPSTANAATAAVRSPSPVRSGSKKK